MTLHVLYYQLLCFICYSEPCLVSYWSVLSSLQKLLLTDFWSSVVSFFFFFVSPPCFGYLSSKFRPVKLGFDKGLRVVCGWGWCKGPQYWCDKGFVRHEQGLRHKGTYHVPLNYMDLKSERRLRKFMVKETLSKRWETGCNRMNSVSTQSRESRDIPSTKTHTEEVNLPLRSNRIRPESVEDLGFRMVDQLWISYK